MKNIIIINGPNLNLLGKREPEIYGSKTFDVFFNELQSEFPQFKLDYFQSNIEGELINKLHDEIEIIINQFIESVSSDSKQDFINMLETINWKASCYINEL